MSTNITVVQFRRKVVVQFVVKYYCAANCTTSPDRSIVEYGLWALDKWIPSTFKRRLLVDQCVRSGVSRERKLQLFYL